MPRIFRLGGPNWSEEFLFYSASDRPPEEWYESLKAAVGVALGQISFHDPPAPREWVRRLVPTLEKRGFAFVKAPLAHLDDRTGRVRTP